MLKIVGIALSREGSLTELEIKNAWNSQETVDRRLGHVLIACTKGEANNYVCNLERSGVQVRKQMVSRFKVWK